MTTQDKPAVGALSAEDVPLLVKGDLLRYDGHVVEFDNADTGEPLVLFTNGPALRVSPGACAFIGRSGPGGWIPCRFRSVPDYLRGLRVEAKTYNDLIRPPQKAENVAWTSMVAFRLAPTAPVETLGETAAFWGNVVADRGACLAAALGLREAKERLLQRKATLGDMDAIMDAIRALEDAATQPDTGKVEAGGVEPSCMKLHVMCGDGTGTCDLCDPPQALRPQPSGETREKVARLDIKRIILQACLAYLSANNTGSVKTRHDRRVLAVNDGTDAILALITPADQAKGGEG